MNAEHRPVVFMMPGDLHLTEAGLPNHDTAEWVVDEANDFIRPDFLQFIGDNVQDATADQFRMFHDLSARLQVPWHALVGDHDVKGDPGAVSFRKWVGDPCGSLRLNGFRFVRLNTQEARPVGISTQQLTWFESEVAEAFAAGERVILFQHNYPYQIWEDFSGPGIDDWRAIVQTRAIHGIFCGHTHYWQLANDGRNVHVATRSIGDPEGGPPGYTLVYLSGNDLSVTYRTVEDRGPLVLITSPRTEILCTGPDNVVCGNAAIRARIWSRRSVVEVSGHLDDGPPLRLECSAPLDWHAPLSARLTKGVHRLTVRAEDKSGSVGEQHIAFVVDPTGRFTAIPRVDPVVSATDYC